MDRKLLRKVQLEQLEMAKEIKRVCKVLNISYFLDSGTLLGAVRHNGFIPWDDDLDIGMLRDDYEKFVREAPGVLDTKYFLQTWTSDPEYGMAFAKLRKNNTVYLENVAQKSNAHCGFYVDIFPYDVYPDEPKKQKWQGRRYNSLRRCLLVKCGYKPWRSEENTVSRFLKYMFHCPIRMFSCVISRRKMIEQYQEMCSKFNCESSTFLYAQAGASKYGKWLVPRECFDKLIYHKFEDDVFLIPEKYDLYLRSVYGDYMKLPPEEKRENRHGIVCVKFENE